MDKKLTPTTSRNFTKNVIKGIITSIIGLLTMLVTLFLIFTGSMDFIWSGVVGLCLGTILLLAPDTIIKKLGDVIRVVGFNKVGSDANATDVVDIKKDEATKKED